MFLELKSVKQESLYIPFLVESGNFKIDFDINDPQNYTINGGTNNELLKEYEHEFKLARDLSNDYYDKNRAILTELEQSGKVETEEYKNLRKEREQLLNKILEINKKYSDMYKGQPIGLYMLYKGISVQGYNSEDYKAEFDKYSPDLKNSSLGKKTEAYIAYLAAEEIKQIKVGSKLPEFRALTTEGKELTLTELLQGKKLVLVDVWAAWCSPCRRENPNIVKAYKMFKDKGLDIIGYSLDKSDAA